MITCRNVSVKWLAIALFSFFSPLVDVEASELSKNETVKASSYADIADLADSAPLILRVELRKIIKLDAIGARIQRLGLGRFYVEAKPIAIFNGGEQVSDSIRYIADLPIDAKGRPPALKKVQMLVFGRTVPGRPGDVQLVTPEAQVRWDVVTETRLRGIIAELKADNAPPRIIGVREVLHVPGDLSGEGETQIFLATSSGSAAAIVVTRRGGMRPSWGASFSEVIESGAPPQSDTLPWYRLACFLPRKLPAGSNLSDTVQSKEVAEQDYRLVLADLGPCTRNY